MLESTARVAWNLKPEGRIHVAVDLFSEEPADCDRRGPDKGSSLALRFAYEVRGQLAVKQLAERDFSTWRGHGLLEAAAHRLQW